jgi:hypothetical protein
MVAIYLTLTAPVEFEGERNTGGNLDSGGVIMQRFRNAIESRKVIGHV